MARGSAYRSFPRMAERFRLTLAQLNATVGAIDANAA
jgi:hypothetical protein